MSPPIHPLSSSQGAVFLINSRQRNFSCVPIALARIGKALYRRYGRFFAEFLEDLSLVRLGLLALTTCVGLRYDLYENILRRFSRKHARNDQPRRTGTYPLVCESALKPEGGFSYLHSSAHELKSNNEPFVLCSVPSSFNIQVTEY